MSVDVNTNDNSVAIERMIAGDLTLELAGLRDLERELSRWARLGQREAVAQLQQVQARIRELSPQVEPAADADETGGPELGLTRLKAKADELRVWVASGVEDAQRELVAVQNRIAELEHAARPPDPIELLQAKRRQLLYASEVDGSGDVSPSGELAEVERQLAEAWLERDRAALQEQAAAYRQAEAQRQQVEADRKAAQAELDRIEAKYQQKLGDVEQATEILLTVIGETAQVWVDRDRVYQRLDLHRGNPVQDRLSGYLRYRLGEEMGLPGFPALPDALRQIYREQGLCGGAPTLGRGDSPEPSTPTDSPAAVRGQSDLREIPPDSSGTMGQIPVCSAGHKLVPENVYTRPGIDKQECRTCRTIRRQLSEQRKREQGE